MSVDTTFVVFCDAEDCFEDAHAMAPTASLARLVVRDSLGWSISAAGDYCPTHNGHPITPSSGRENGSHGDPQ